MRPADPFIDRKILDGQFHIIKKIGTGGMGSVYKALQVDMNRAVAIKILHPKLANRKDLASRFRREARAMSQLTHPNTVKVFNYGQLMEDPGQGSLYIVMEYLDGRNLNRAVRREGPFAVERAVAILIQVCGALEEAHNMGIVHRDMKPENIFLCRQGDFLDYPKVLDFGLAKVTEQQMRPGSIQLTQEGMVFGTPEFMSPEQAQGKTLDARSDIYSLAIILYEAITGKLPFVARTPMEYIQKHVMEKPIPLDERIEGQHFAPGLGDAISKALAKDPAARYQRAIDFAMALRSFAGTAGARVDAIFQMSPAAPSTDLTPASPNAPVVAEGPGDARAGAGVAASHSPVPPSGTQGKTRNNTLILVLIAAVFLLIGATLAVFVLLAFAK
jgi:eukaryotic-like serine/threonine-protein kinase